MTVEKKIDLTIKVINKAFKKNKDTQGQKMLISLRRKCLEIKAVIDNMAEGLPDAEKAKAVDDVFKNIGGAKRIGRRHIKLGDGFVFYTKGSAYLWRLNDFDVYRTPADEYVGVIGNGVKIITQETITAIQEGYE